MLASTLCDAATVLAEAARATPSEARAYHPAGMADAAGFVAMDTNELLVHTNDILDGIDPGSHLRAPRRSRPRPTLPVVAPEAPPGEALAWANGRAALPGHDNPGRHLAVALRTSGGVGRDGPVLGPSGQPARRPAVRGL